MTRLRARIAERLLQSQSTNAILTTFNEVNMAPVIEMRKRFQEKFEKEHGVKIGFMSFFVKAAVAALKRYPVINASVDGNDIVYHGYFDIGIAVGSPRGLVVPILRNADQMSFADIEKKIAEYGKKASDGKLSLDELTGGTFSISNGGVFGSMLSTPIINPPQSAILGVHATKDRAVVENGQIVVRPMNYLAMSYDHRIIDGREAVLGLVAMKEALEDPAAPVRHLTWRPQQRIRRRRHRRRPGRLHRRDPRRAARLFDRLHRRVEERQGRPGAGRHLHQRRLHSVEGAAAVVGELRARRPPLRRPRHRRRQADDRRREDAGAQGDRREAEQRRHPLPVQEEQGRVLPRPRLVRRPRRGRHVAGRGRRREGRDDHRQARHRRHRLEPARVAGRAVRRGEHPLQRRRARASTPCRRRSA